MYQRQWRERRINELAQQIRELECFEEPWLRSDVKAGMIRALQFSVEHHRRQLVRQCDHGPTASGSCGPMGAPISGASTSYQIERVLGGGIVAVELAE